MTDPGRIRLWPAVLLILLASLLVGVAPFAFTRTMVHFLSIIAGPVLATFGILVWWAAFSRVRGMERWLPPIAFIVGLASLLVAVYRDDPLKPFLYYGPVIAVLWVLWLCAAYRLEWLAQYTGVLIIVIGGWSLLGATIRIDQTDAEMIPEFRFAWDPTAAEKLERDRALHANDPKPAAAETLTIQPDDWPEFRGPKRDGAAMTPIRTNWSENPPKELWRRRVGAGWGSFAIVGDRAFTQEQRGNDEALVCYHALTGYEFWVTVMPGRFFEGIAGEGPRATPTIFDGKAYAYSGTGKLLCADALSGKQIWLKDVAAELGAKVPQWGFASSPLIIDGKVIVFTALAGQATAAYTLNGELAWSNGSGTHGYSSAHAATFHGEEQVLMVSDFGLEAFRPSNGELRWAVEWKFPGQNRVAQPTILGNSEVLLGTAVGNGQGARRIRVKPDWTTEVLWDARAPKPYFNDGVVCDGSFYGWDDRNFICLDLKSSRITWNAGSTYGFGQVVLLPGKKLLVQAESGKVLVLDANPQSQKVIAKLDAMNKKTWNHPVAVHGKLYLRNGEEAVCYDVSELK